MFLRLVVVVVALSGLAVWAAVVVVPSVTTVLDVTVGSSLRLPLMLSSKDDRSITAVDGLAVLIVIVSDCC